MNGIGEDQNIHENNINNHNNYSNIPNQINNSSNSNNINNNDLSINGNYNPPHNNNNNNINNNNPPTEIKEQTLLKRLVNNINNKLNTLIDFLEKNERENQNIFKSMKCFICPSYFMEISLVFQLILIIHFILNLEEYYINAFVLLCFMIQNSSCYSTYIKLFTIKSKVFYSIFCNIFYSNNRNLEDKALKRLAGVSLNNNNILIKNGKRISSFSLLSLLSIREESNINNSLENIENIENLESNINNIVVNDNISNITTNNNNNNNIHLLSNQYLNSLNSNNTNHNNHNNNNTNITSPTKLTSTDTYNLKTNLINNFFFKKNLCFLTITVINLLMSYNNNFNIFMRLIYYQIIISLIEILSLKVLYTAKIFLFSMGNIIMQIILIRILRFQINFLLIEGFLVFLIMSMAFILRKNFNDFNFQLIIAEEKLNKLIITNFKLEKQVKILKSFYYNNTNTNNNRNFNRNFNSNCNNFIIKRINDCNINRKMKSCNNNDNKFQNYTANTDFITSNSRKEHDEEIESKKRKFKSDRTELIRVNKGDHQRGQYYYMSRVNSNAKNIVSKNNSKNKSKNNSKNNKGVNNINNNNSRSNLINEHLRFNQVNFDFIDNIDSSFSSNDLNSNNDEESKLKSNNKSKSNIKSNNKSNKNMNNETKRTRDKNNANKLTLDDLINVNPLNNIKENENNNNRKENNKSHREKKSSINCNKKLIIKRGYTHFNKDPWAEEGIGSSIPKEKGKFRSHITDDYSDKNLENLVNDNNNSNNAIDNNSNINNKETNKNIKGKYNIEISTKKFSNRRKVFFDMNVIPTRECNSSCKIMNNNLNETINQLICTYRKDDDIIAKEDLLKKQSNNDILNKIKNQPNSIFIKKEDNITKYFSKSSHNLPNINKIYTNQVILVAETKGISKKYSINKSIVSKNASSKHKRNKKKLVSNTVLNNSLPHDNNTNEFNNNPGLNISDINLIEENFILDYIKSSVCVLKINNEYLKVNNNVKKIFNVIYKNNMFLSEFFNQKKETFLSFNPDKKMNNPKENEKTVLTSFIFQRELTKAYFSQTASSSGKKKNVTSNYYNHPEFTNNTDLSNLIEVDLLNYLMKFLVYDNSYYYLNEKINKSMNDNFDKNLDNKLIFKCKRNDEFYLVETSFLKLEEKEEESLTSRTIIKEGIISRKESLSKRRNSHDDNNYCSNTNSNNIIRSSKNVFRFGNVFTSNTHNLLSSNEAKKILNFNRKQNNEENEDNEDLVVNINMRNTDNINNDIAFDEPTEFNIFDHSPGNEKKEMTNSNKYFKLESVNNYYKLSNILFLNRDQREEGKVKILVQLSFTKVTEFVKMHIKNLEMMNEQKTKLAHTAHEFKTPLNAIVDLSNEIKNKINMANFDIHEEISNISSISSYTFFLIADFIQVSKGLSTINIAYKKVELSTIIIFAYNIAKTLNSYFYGKSKVNIEIEIDDEVKNNYIKTDEIRLKQVLLNFISNSVKFTKKGNIKISCLKNHEKDCLEISVMDTGIGMPQQLVSNLINKKFDKIQVDREVNSQGTGIGIDFSTRIINSLGYGFNIESAIKRGTKISIYVSYNFLSKSNLDDYSQDEDYDESLPSKYRSRRRASSSKLASLKKYMHQKEPLKDNEENYYNSKNNNHQNNPNHSPYEDTNNLSNSPIKKNLKKFMCSEMMNSNTAANDNEFNIEENVETAKFSLFGISSLNKRERIKRDHNNNSNRNNTSNRHNTSNRNNTSNNKVITIFDRLKLISNKHSNENERQTSSLYALNNKKTEYLNSKTPRKRSNKETNPNNTKKKENSTMFMAFENRIKLKRLFNYFERRKSLRNVLISTLRLNLLENNVELNFNSNKKQKIIDFININNNFITIRLKKIIKFCDLDDILYYKYASSVSKFNNKSNFINNFNEKNNIEFQGEKSERNLIQLFPAKNEESFQLNNNVSFLKNCSNYEENQFIKLRVNNTEKEEKEDNVSCHSIKSGSTIIKSFRVDYKALNKQVKNLNRTSILSHRKEKEKTNSDKKIKFNFENEGNVSNYINNNLIYLCNMKKKTFNSGIISKKQKLYNTHNLNNPQYYIPTTFYNSANLFDKQKTSHLLDNLILENKKTHSNTNIINLNTKTSRLSKSKLIQRKKESQDITRDKEIFIKSTEIKKRYSDIEVNFNQKIIIVIDDVFVLRNQMKNLLKKIIKAKNKEDEILVFTGTDGSDLIWYVTEDQDNQSICCVFCDENMEYINGSKAVSLLVNSNKDNKIRYLPYFICSTNFEDDYIKDKLLLSGFNKVIDKNIKKVDLENLLVELEVLEVFNENNNNNNN